MSLLPIVRFCGKAGALAREYGAGRPAAMSQAFHASQAGGGEAASLLALLTDSERAEVEKWNPVADVVIGDAVLVYREAEKELAVGLDEFGAYCEPGSPDCISVGHLDFGWVHQTDDFQRIAYVGDIKKTVWTTIDGPESLQLHAYGWAFARKYGCDAYCTGLWCATEGEWLWSKEMVALSSERGQQIWEAIYSAATKSEAEANTGGHCRSCWSRLHCPEHVLPAALASTELAPLAAGHLPTAEEAPEFLARLQTLGELVDLCKKNLQEAVRRGAIRIEANGKVWGPIQVKGRASVDVAKLREELGDVARFMKQGAPFDQFRWINSKEAP